MLQLLSLIPSGSSTPAARDAGGSRHHEAPIENSLKAVEYKKNIEKTVGYLGLT